MANICNLNGKILPEEDARVPVLDRGFLFGDSIYEVIRTHGGIPFAWIEHLQRLRHSAEGIGMELGLEDYSLMRRIKETVQAGANPESYIRIVVTRGTGVAPNIDLAYAPGPVTCVILVRPLPTLATTEARLAIVKRLRNDRRALDPAIKSGNYLNNVLGLAEAKAAGATDCLFLNRAGHLTETSTSNIFLVRDREVFTPPLDAGLLAGITRGLLFNCCDEEGVAIGERELTEADVRGADEMFVTSTSREVAPVTHLDGEPVGDGSPGPVTQRLAKLFRDYCRRRTAEIYRPRYEAL